MYGKTQKILSVVLYIALGAGVIFLCVRFLLPWLAPFIVAFVLAFLMEPAVKRLQKRGMPRGVAAGLCTVLLFLLIGALLYFLLSNLVHELTGLTGSLPGIFENLIGLLIRLRDWLFEFIDRFDGSLGEYLRSAVDSLTDQLSAVPGWLSGYLLSFAGAVAAKTPEILLFSVTCLIGVYFISASYHEISSFLWMQVPKGWKSRMLKIKDDIKRTIGRWFRAQLILMLITFLELLVAFMLLRVNYSFLMAIFVAIVDALPVLGTGTVLIPWAIVSLLGGNYAFGIGLVVTYAAVTLLRNLIQAKLLGDQLGLHPLATLVSIYVGYRVWGVMGMLVFPILTITLTQMNDSGLIKLWKTKENGAST